jgi:transcription factor C subunit 7
VDPKTGEYSTNILGPTKIPSDPALASKGVEQAKQLAVHLSKLEPKIERIYSSPFYRCIQTILPTAIALSESSSSPLEQDLKIRPENGIGEWYGTARFDHPSPASPTLLATLFPKENFNKEYTPFIRPSVSGETIASLHERTAYALHRIIEQCDDEGVKAVVICTHAATLIAAGRALTGRMPEDTSEEDFWPYTCGVSVFVRKTKTLDSGVGEWKGVGSQVPEVKWKDGKGVGGGWECTVHGDCSFLKDGAERVWHFSGDEAFDTTPALDVSSALGSGESKKETPSPSRL